MTPLDGRRGPFRVERCWATGYTEYRPYSITLQQLLDAGGYSAKVRERGKSGDTVLRGMMKRLPALLEEAQHLGLRVDWLVLMGGINDIIRHAEEVRGAVERNETLPLEYGLMAEEVWLGLQKLYGVCGRHGVKVLALTLLETGWELPEVEAERARLNDLIRGAHVRHDHVHVLDVAQDLPYPSGSSADPAVQALWDDVVHLSPAGYDRLGALVYDGLKHHLEKR
ncbi:hypothetical protein HYH03_004473 [Edaphochlamys debaryana]|uniref:SGNH hydrolase-type esterase domain-containing protein n=1 Tax=Edaphochlamys debaryana TaxID=47281 RepID=A0A836C2D9_9CHLO|nr:hypothetical protein HYH03_004473 [Edaphochlamys debaryana]|eukprot:KAG2497740.1 hypothetical protein HYH03_004473 [Edaphochlamys debaryana]